MLQATRTKNSNQKKLFVDKIEQMINNAGILEVLGKNAYDFINDWNNEEILNKWYRIFT